MVNSVMVSTGSRLHLGLTRIRPAGTGRYGGLGVMIEQPRTTVHVARNPTARDPDYPVSRAERFARRWIRSLDHSPREPLSVRLTESPPEHSGFGSGTQLAQAVAAGVNRVLDLPAPDGLQVARILDRGNRSMVGSLGFAMGGCLVDDANPASGQTGLADVLQHRRAIPETWRVLLVRHQPTRRTFGERERAAFDRLGNGDGEAARHLEQLIDERILPALEAADFSAFGEAVFEYGQVSGNYYSEIQGGPYNGPHVTRIVDLLRGSGVQGVGQSSWGPVVFGWCRDDAQADAVARQIELQWGADCEVTGSGVCNVPAIIRAE